MTTSELFLKLSEAIPWMFVGFIAVKAFRKISDLKDQLHRFKEFDHRFVVDDVRRLDEKRWQTPSREEMQQHLHTLCARILVLETKLSEREKAKE